MKLLYVGYYVEPKLFQSMIDSGDTSLSQARQNFEERLLGEFSQNLNHDDWKIVSYVPCVAKDFPTHSEINGKKIDVFKISKKNQLSSVKAFFNFCRYLIKNSIKNCNVLMYSVHPVLSLPLFLLRKKLNLTITTICSEVPQFKAAGNPVSFLRKQQLKLQAWENRKFDKYILFAEAMKNIIPITNKNYTVVEGICPDEFSKPIAKKENIVMYAGGLGKHNNIELLINACEKSEKVSELWIFGMGDCLEEIKKRTNDKIKYMGNLPSAEVFEYEKKAKLLVNLRNPEIEITKYAFPSKILEYMSSGSAVLTTKLEGIPKEYFKFINTVEDLSEIGVKEAIENVLDMDDDTYVSHCKKAQNFMKENKTAAKQAERILDFVLNK